MVNQWKIVRRVFALVMCVAAFAWGAEILRQASGFNDAGPPLGAICMAVPSILLLIAAAVVWSSTTRRDDRHTSDQSKTK